MPSILSDSNSSGIKPGTVQHHHVIAAGRSQERAGRPEGTVPPWLTAHGADRRGRARAPAAPDGCAAPARRVHPPPPRDRKSTRLNSSHVAISYAVLRLTNKTTFVTPSRPELMPRHTTCTSPA